MSYKPYEGDFEDFRKSCQQLNCAREDVLLGEPGDQITEVEFLWRLQQLTDRRFAILYRPGDTPADQAKKMQETIALIEEEHELERRYRMPR